jgi:hypothetical protein
MTMPGPEPDVLAREAVRTADDLFPAEARPDFSESGYREFTGMVGGYVSDLVDETYRETRRQHADRVTPEYVRQASKRLTSSRRRASVTFAGSLGGIVLGSSLGLLPGWIGAKTIDPSQAIVVVILALVGGGLLVGAFVMELVGR